MRSKRPIPPHRILTDEDLWHEHPGAWLAAWGNFEAVIRSGEVLPHWEPGLDIRLSNRLRLKPSARDRLGGEMADGMGLEVVLLATTAGGLQTAGLARSPLRLDSSETFLELALDGGGLARDLVVQMTIAVSRPSSGDRLMPELPGSRLWTSEWRARIEGGRSRLALEQVDFARHFGNLQAEALVHLVVADDPLLDAEQGLTVYLNARRIEFVHAVARKEVYATAILWDAVLRQAIVLGAEHQFSLWDNYPEGSLGRQWQAWIREAFPQSSTEDVLAMHQSRVSDFEARIQSWARIGVASDARGNAA